jgi:hypothetical protein
MDYLGVIRNFHWQPMVEIVPSILQLEVQVYEDGITRTTEERGSINYLSKKYGFLVEGNNYDFTPVVGRECRLRNSPGGFYLS